MQRADLAGQKFGRLTAIARAESAPNRCSRWICSCECGNQTIVAIGNLTNGHTKSCGCLKSEVLKKEHELNITHGSTGTRLYNIWNGIKARTHYKLSNRYAIYGGRGISMCDEWYNSFVSFKEWAIDSGYKETYSIDRINNNGNYEPENCRWVDTQTQANNRRSNRTIIIGGVARNLCEWSALSGIGRATIAKRIERGWQESDLLIPPQRPNYQFIRKGVARCL